MKFAHPNDTPSNPAGPEDPDPGTTKPTPVGQPSGQTLPERPDLSETVRMPAGRPDLDQTTATPAGRPQPGPAQVYPVPDQPYGTQTAQDPAVRTGAEVLAPPPAQLPPKATRRLPSWRRLTLLGLLLLILIAFASGLAGYRAGIGRRQRAEATQVAAQLDNQYNLALQEIEAGQYGRARQRLEYIININPGYPGVTDKLAQVLLSQNSTATPTVAPSPTVTPTPDNRGVEELYSQAQILLQNSDWPAAIDTLLALRKADPNHQPVWVDDMLYLSLRSQGRDKILKSADLEGGIYDLTLAERFGPLDAETKSYQTWAELYLVGASFWKLDWGQAVYYFGQVAPAMPNLRDGSGLTATERYRQALVGYAESFAKAEDWCAALEQYEVVLTLGTVEDVQAAYDQAYEMCAGVVDEGAPPEAAPTAEITPEITQIGVTPAPTAAVTPEPTIAVTEAPPTAETTVETPVDQVPTQDPNATPSP